MEEPIVAISTALNESAIAIVRLSGQGVIDLADRLFSGNLTGAASHTIHYGWIIQPQTHEKVDEVLVSVFRAPRSYTREDMVEINTHGGIYLTRKILSLCIGQGARLATAGEFSQRAFLNGRIDLTQAEAIMDLIEADNEQQTELAVAGMQGKITQEVEPLCAALRDLLAQIAMSLDYPEYEEAQQVTAASLLAQGKQLLTVMEHLFQEARRTRMIRNGIQTVILGKPNVGKSSLFNALVKEDKAIVTEIAGTTRDPVEATVRLEQITLHLVDTAGIHETTDPIEQIGMQKSLDVLHHADLVLVLLDGTRPLDEQDRRILEATRQRQPIILTNKADQPCLFHQGIAISALNGQIDPLIAEINRRYAHHSLANSSSLNNDRQIGLLLRATDALREAVAVLESGREVDLASLALQESYQACGEIIGITGSDDLLDTVFSRFCLGK